MAANHYETLGVQPDATADDILQAKRRRASEAHPDKGGTDAEMAAVNRAYVVLADPAKRAAYDAGETEEQPSFESMAAEAVRELFSEALSRPGINIVSNAREKLSTAQAQMDAAEPSMQQSIRHLQKRRTKIRTRDGVENVAHALIDKKVAGFEEQLQAIKVARVINARALELVQAYEDDEQPPERITAGKFFNLEREVVWPR